MRVKMATQVSSILKDSSKIPVTRDLLGELSKSCESGTNKDQPSHVQGSDSPLSSSSSVSYTELGLKVSNIDEGCTLNLKLDEFSTQYNSVCTLEKVKTALKRVEAHESSKKRSLSSLCEKEEISEKSKGTLFAARCPGCFFYVITSNICPRCKVPIFPSDNCVAKKVKIDLN